jgi:hypothetical protein
MRKNFWLVDEYLQFDVANPKLPEYKFYVLLNPYYITDEEFNAIRNLASAGRVHIQKGSCPVLRSAQNGKGISINLFLNP